MSFNPLRRTSQVLERGREEAFAVGDLQEILLIS